MLRRCRQPGMTLLEVITALAIIIILAGASLVVSKKLQQRANSDLEASLLEVLDTALQQYYDDSGGKFPFDTPDINSNGILGDDYLTAELETDLGGTVSGSLPTYNGVNPLNPSQSIQVSSASSAALFYYLNKSPNSRKIADAVSGTLTTNKDAKGQDIQITIASGTIDLPRYIDPWKISIQYQYIDGTAFPVLTSAGPDKVFGTADDITNK